MEAITGPRWLRSGELFCPQPMLAAPFLRFVPRAKGFASALRLSIFLILTFQRAMMLTEVSGVLPIMEMKLGQTKRYLDEIEEQRAWALNFLVNLGTLNECEFHPGIYYDGDADLERAYRTVNAMITKGQIVLEPGEARLDRTDSLKRVYKDNSGPESCFVCDKHAED